MSKMAVMPLFCRHHLIFFSSRIGKPGTMKLIMKEWGLGANKFYSNYFLRLTFGFLWKSQSCAITRLHEEIYIHMGGSASNLFDERNTK